jgi:glycosyltransferase involved in cell wall biosynthesis
VNIQVGIDYTAAVHQSAGIGRYTRELVRALAASAAAWPEVCYHLFVAGANQSAVPPSPGWPNFAWHPTRLTERWLARLWYRLRLPLWVESWTGPLHLFHQPDFVLPPVRPETRTIVTVHDLSFVRNPDTVMPGMAAHLNRWVPYSVGKADHVIAVSEATRQDLIEFYQTPPEKISVLYHGVTPEFEPVREPARLAAVRQRYGLGQQPFVLSLGTIQPRKNHRRLVEAFAQVDSDLLLVIAGKKGWAYQELFEEVARWGLADRVHFPGFVAEADLPALYSAAELFIYPSLCEGFGLPLAEAMACGTPVITSNRSSLPEVVGDAGLLIDPEDTAAMAGAMASVLQDSSLRRRLAEAGRARAACFTWEAMAVRLIRLYQSLVTGEN